MNCCGLASGAAQWACEQPPPVVPGQWAAAAGRSRPGAAALADAALAAAGVGPTGTAMTIAWSGMGSAGASRP
jgi:hypothetical protein